MTFTSNREPLSPLLIERGYVEEELIFQSGLFTVSHLYLSPGAKIKKHRHTVDNELYLIVETGERFVCLVGEEHDLENTTDKLLKILSIKYPPTK